MAAMHSTLTWRELSPVHFNEILAVNVTGCRYMGALGLATSAVLDDACPTVALTALEVLGMSVASPL